MSRAAQRILAAGERPYDVAVDAMGELGGLLAEEKHAGVAYTLWAEISDLYDDPRGPGSETLCDRVARAAAIDWKAVDLTSRHGVAMYFDTWKPGDGAAWKRSMTERSPDDGSALPSLDRLVYLLSGDLQSDDLPLWEIVWTLNTLAPTAALEDKIHLARRATAVLVGQYDLWRGEWPGGPIAPLTQSETERLASEETPWYDPERATLLVWIREEGAGAPE